MTDNPWGVTAAEAIAIEAVSEWGSYKAAARRLGKSARTIENQTSMAAKRMGVRSGFVVVALKWDRWKRGNA